MSEPWPPAFMRTAPPTDPGHADGPRQPAPSRRRPPGGPARAGPPRLRPARRRTPGRRRSAHRSRAGRPPAKPAPRCSTIPSNPSSATSRLEPRPRTKTAAGRRPSPAPCWRQAVRTASRSLGSFDLDVERRRPADAVGGQRPERLVPAWPARRGRRPGRRRPSPGRHHCGDSSSSSGSVVRSPAPEGEAEVARAAARPRRSGAAPPSPPRRRPGSRGSWSRTASATRRPDTPGTGRSPAL